MFSHPMMFERGPPSNAPASDCGTEFDAYVKEVLLDEDPPREVDFWKGRKLHFYPREDQKVDAKVVKWRQSSNQEFNNFSFYHTCWELTIEFSGEFLKIPEHDFDFDTMDTNVTICNTSDENDGKTGRIVQGFPNNTYKLQLKDAADPETFVTLPKEDLVKNAEEHTFRVSKMNVHGGGILQRYDGGSKFSIEWLDPPSPAYEEPHTTITSMLPSGVTEPDMDEADLQREREQAYQKLRSLLPHTFMNGTATQPSEMASEQDGEDIDKAMGDFGERIKSIFSKLDEFLDVPGAGVHPVLSFLQIPLTPSQQVSNDKLDVFWTELRKAPIQIFCLDGPFANFVHGIHCMAAVAIVRLVIQERLEDVAETRKLFLESGGTYQSGPEEEEPSEDDKSSVLSARAKGYSYALIVLCHTRMGELWELDKDYNSSICWYEQAVSSSLKRLELEGEASVHAKDNLGCQYTNLGLAMKRAGKLSKAQECYKSALEQYENIEEGKKLITNNKEALDAELRRWTGTSGRLTPGC